MGVDNKGLFCLVGVYDDQDHRQESEEEEDLKMIMEEEEEDSTSSFNDSSRSGSSLDSGDDAPNSYSSSSSSRPNGALYDLSELMSNLPIKRGLSKFYQGKSQSFTSLARVTSLEDLAKKSNTYKARKVKACKIQRSPYYSTSPKSTISKKSSSFSCLRAKTATCFIANS